jgi:MFS family permease
LVLASQIGIAVGQPLVIGAITKIGARWFPVRERATATGLGTLALYVGPLAAMLLSPYLLVRSGMKGMLLIYGIGMAATAVLFLAVAKEHPPTPAGRDERVLMFDGLKAMVRQKDFLLLLAIFFIGLGLFNGVSTWVEDIVRPRGFTIAEAGTLGALMLAGGIVGAIASDWNINGILTLSDGRPFTVGATNRANTGSGTSARANCIGDPVPGGFVQNVDHWMDIGAFSQPAAFTYGTCGYNSMRGPGFKSMNFSLFRGFPFSSGRRLEFRLETFNLFNWVNYDFPAASVGNPATFGKITASLGGPREMQMAVKFYF